MVTSKEVLTKSKPEKVMVIGIGFVPEVLNVELYDEFIQMKTEEVFEYARRVAVKKMF